jgi:hypothetical protein
MLKIIIPCHGDNSDNFDKLISSIDMQDLNPENYEVFFCEDIVEDNFRKKLEKLKGSKFLVENYRNKRLFGLFNVCRVLDDLIRTEEEPSNTVVGIIDSDDYLWGKNCFSNILSEYKKGFDCVWTANEWEGLGLNHSGPLQQNCDVYKHPWVTSHFKTFKLSDYKTVPKKNFKNRQGEWFEACYDQALMLPILHNVIKRGGKTKFLNKVHYIYRGNLKEESEYRQKQLEYESFIRTRGYLK